MKYQTKRHYGYDPDLYYDYKSYYNMIGDLCEFNKEEHLPGAYLKDGKRLSIGEGTLKMEREGLAFCDHLETILFPSSLWAIPDSLCYSCLNLMTVVMKDGTREIRELAFALCKSLTHLTLPQSLKAIGKYAFLECNSIQRLELPKSLTTIDYGAFAGCEYLEYVSLPRYIKSVGRGVFMHCTSLMKINCYSLDPWKISIYDDAFKGIDMKKCQLNVPPQSIELYQKHPVFGQFKRIFPISPWPPK